MIIKITQTESNARQSYEIEGEDFYFSGNAGSVAIGKRQSRAFIISPNGSIIFPSAT